MKSKTVTKKVIKERLDKLRELFADHVKIETLNNAEIEKIVIFDDTLKNLKPIFDKYKAALEFEKKEEDTWLHYYIPLTEFYNFFEPALVEAETLPLDDILQSLIIYDEDHHFGYDMFLKIVDEIRNPKPIEIEIPFEPPAKEMRKFY